MATWGGNASVFDTIGSIYGSGSSPSYYGEDLNGPVADADGNIGPIPQAANVDNAVHGVKGSTNLAPGLAGTIFGEPVTHLFVLGFMAIGIYYVIHRTVPGVEEHLATPRIGIGSFLSIGIQAMLFLALTKIVAARYHVPGLSPLVLSA
jgi:hypothetical protein